MEKNFEISSIEVERFKNERFTWIYIHAIAPKQDDFDAAADLALLLRNNPLCERVVSTGRDLDLEFLCQGFTFRLTFNSIQGIAIECDYAFTEQVKAMLTPFCNIHLD